MEPSNQKTEKQNKLLKNNPGGSFCDVCSAFIPNVASLEAHIKGKRHIKNLEKKNLIKEITEKSIYVGNLKTSACIELELADYFAKFGSVASITLDKNKGVFAIIEFQNPSTVEKVLSSSTHIVGTNKVTVKRRTFKENNVDEKQISQEDKNKQLLSDNLKTQLCSAKNIFEQCVKLYNTMKLSEEEINIRKLLCQLLQSALQEVFPKCEVIAFGSSANGFGIHNCDLDMNLEYLNVNYEAASEFLSTKPKNNDLNTKDVLVVASEIIKRCVPDCKKIKTLLNARLPVVRFLHGTSQMRCDISVQNSIAVLNTRYLRSCVNNDKYFLYLVFFIRFWMKHWKLSGTTECSGGGFNNYATTLLVLFFMLQKKRIPTLQQSRKDTQVEPDYQNNWDCSFVDIQLPPDALTEIKSDTDFSNIIAEFFEFYGKLECQNIVLNLSYGTLQTKEEFIKDQDKIHKSYELSSNNKYLPFRFGAVNIQDPFELNHNVAGNVGKRQAEIFIKCIRNASLACKMTKFNTKSKNRDDPWGLLNLFVDHHNKKGAKDKAYKIILQSNNNDDNDLNLLEACSELNLKMYYAVLTSLTNVYLMDCYYVKDVKTLEVGSENIGATIQSSVIEELINVSNTSNEIDLDENKNVFTDSKNVNGTRKRKASDDIKVHKRAKIALTSPVTKAVNRIFITTKETVDFPVTILCKSKHDVWQGRRKARRKLVQTGKNDILELEKAVSNILISEKSQKEDMEGEVDNTFEFELVVGNLPNNGMSLEFFPQTTTKKECTDKLFSTFFHHAETFLPTFVKKCIKQIA